MSNTPKHLAAVIATLFAALGTAGIAMGESDVVTQASTETQTIDAAEGPLQCEIQAVPERGGVMLEGLVRAETPINGSYRFQVITSGRSGSSNVSQGGYFSAGPDKTTILGKVMLGNRDATYDINLEVTSDGETVECVKHIDRVI